MAEFVDVVKNWTRMCSKTMCCDCSLKGHCIIGSLEDDDARVIEKIVTRWAAEHPEPVYETWFEYLIRIGVIPVYAPAGGEYQWIVENIKNNRISEDIARKLGLEPKEVKNDA